MKVIKNDNNQPLTLAELEVCRQLERSQQAGEALFRPQLAAGQPAPNCVAFLKKTGRFAITILGGRYTVDGGQWWRHEENGVQTPIDNPLEAAWQAGKSVRIELNHRLERSTYVIAVVWFPDMEEDEDILDEAGGRSLGLVFGEVDLVQRLVNLPRDGQLQTSLGRRLIQQEVAVLSRAPAPEATTLDTAAPDTAALEVGEGKLVIHHVDVVNVYIIVGSDGAGGISLRDILGR